MDGVDYQEIFSPAAKLNNVRVLLSLVANLDWPLHQFDVKNAFLHGDLEKMYMDIPSRYMATSDIVVCKLTTNSVWSKIITSSLVCTA